MLVQDLKSRNIFAGIQGKNSSNDKVELLEDLVPLFGVQSIDIRWSHTIGVREGISATFLQPWYNKPVEIEIQGLSYIGMTGGQSIASSLASQQDTKQKQIDKNDIITKALPKVRSGVEQIARGVLDTIKFPVGLSIDILNGTLLNFITTNNISIDDMAQVLGWVPAQVTKYGAYALSEVLTLSGKTAETIRNFVSSTSETFIDKNLPETNKFFEKLEAAKPLISQALRRTLELLKNSIGPKEDRTVYNLKKLISYFSFGPFQYRGANKKDLAHVIIIENEAGQNASEAKEGSFSTFIGAIKDFNYQESVENPYVYEYTINFIGLPDTQSVLTQAKADAIEDTNRGGITLTIHSAKSLLEQGIGLLQTAPKPSIPTIKVL